MHILFVYDRGSNCWYMGQMLNRLSKFGVTYKKVNLNEYMDIKQDKFDTIIYQTFPEETWAPKFNKDLIEKTDVKFSQFKGKRFLLDSFDCCNENAFTRNPSLFDSIPRIKAAAGRLYKQKFDVVFALPGFSLSWMIPNTDGPSYDKRSIKVHCAYGLKGGAAGYPHNIRNEIMDRVKNNFSKETLFESIPTKQYFNFLKTVQISVVAPGHGETSHSAYHNLQAGVCLFHWSAEGHIGKPTTSLEDIKLLPNVDLIPEQDYVSFTMKNLDEKLRYLIDNPKIAEKIGKSGQAKFYKGIDLDASCEQMIKVLQK
jgi:hypothetical protein